MRRPAIENKFVPILSEQEGQEVEKTCNAAFHGANQHKGKTTRAQIDMIEFVRIADALINSFEEDNNADG